MPILWRYMLGQYTKILLLALLAFVGILMATRLDQIAAFAALGGNGKLVARFALLQIPYVLPVAIPICCALASTLLFQRMSQAHELTAMRASGMSFSLCIVPVMLLASFISVGNFYVTSEVGTRSHRSIRELVTKARAINPLALLQSPGIVKRKGLYLDILGSFKAGEHAEDVLVGMYNENSDRLHVGLIDELVGEHEALLANGLHFFSPLQTKEEGAWDHLVLETVETTHTPRHIFSLILGGKGWKLKNDHMGMGPLLTRLKEYTGRIKAQKMEDPEDKSTLKWLRRKRSGIRSEIARRLSVALAVITFTLMGCAYGTTIGRYNGFGGIVRVALMATLYLACFFVAKEFDKQFWLAVCLYLVPHAAIVWSSVRTLKLRSEGVE